MIEIPEHLLERSRAARARLTGQEAPADAPPADDDDEAAGGSEAPAAVAPEPVAAESVAPESVAPEPISPEPLSPEPVSPEPVGAEAAAGTEPTEALPAMTGGSPPAAVLAPLRTTPLDRPFVDFAFPDAADSASRRYLVAAAVWLIVSAVLGFVTALQAVVPGVLSGTASLTYGRLAPTTAAIVVFGWLSLGGMAAAFHIAPRLAGTRLCGERLVNFTLWIWNLALVAGIAGVLAGYQTGYGGLVEFPVWAAAGLEFGFLVTAVAVIGTVMRRTEDVIFPSLWYFAAAGLFATLTYPVAYIPRFAGVNRLIAASFSSRMLLGLWVGMLATGAIYFIVPRITANPLYSRRLAVWSFWGVAFLWVLTGTWRSIYGPGPDFLETFGVAASMALVLPALAVALNVIGTFRARWGALLDSPAAKFALAGSGFLVAAALAEALSALRSVSEVVEFTTVPDGTIALFELGAFTMFLFAFAHYAVPRMTGRQWLSLSAASAHFWLAAIGVGVAVAGLWSAGLSAGLVGVAGSTGEPATTAGDGFQKVVSASRPFLGLAAAGFALFAVAVAVFTGHLLATLAGTRTLRPERWLPEADVEPEEFISAEEAVESVEADADEDAAADAPAADAEAEADDREREPVG